MSNERGDFRFGPIAGVILIVLALVGLFAICNEPDDGDLDTLGRIELVSHEYDDGCWDGECYDGRYGRGGDGGYSEGHQGYGGGGGRGGADYDGDGDGPRCRNFCFYGIPAPGEGGGR